MDDRSSAPQTEFFGPFYLRIPTMTFGISMGLAGHAVMWKSFAVSEFTRSRAPIELCVVFFCAGVFVWVVSVVFLIVKIAVNARHLKAEWKDGVRKHTLNMPNIAVLILSLGSPPGCLSSAAIRWIFLGAFLYQTGMSLSITSHWLYSSEEGHHLANAQTTYLLSVVGWPLLSILAYNSQLTSKVGLDVPVAMLGVGTFMFIMILPAILVNAWNARSHPAQFLLIAPPSVATIALAKIQGHFEGPSKAIFAATLFLMVVLMVNRPTIAKRPPFLGFYWAYTFPLAALATAGGANAKGQASTTAQVLAWVLLAVATGALVIVICRMSVHALDVQLGNDVWGEPLLPQTQSHTEGKVLSSPTPLQPGGSIIAVSALSIGVVSAVDCGSPAGGHPCARAEGVQSGEGQVTRL
mmetsp:Transcript_45410/g.120427  ORF Transcript_45410/g.120427 Transcript_45410/m.120427 type:complete len:409 (-) Transcript_45410:334-1560(-)